MKIRVITYKYEYQGLYFGSMYEIEDQIYITDLSQMLYTFKANGKTWKLFEDECSEVFPAPNEKLLDVINTDLKREECRSSYCECEEGKCSGGKIDMRADQARKIVEKGPIKPNSPIKSDGGSSSYYDLPVSEWLLYTLNERQKEGKCYIKTEEMISAFFGNDFDRGNIIKSLVRCQGLQDGTGGKAGNSVEYECNKMIYSVNKIKEKR